MSHGRRAFLCLGLAAGLGVPVLSHALQRRSLDDPLRVAADDALVDSGLAELLQQTFARDTGVALVLLRGPASSVLQALEHGEHDIGLTNAPAIETRLEQQGLVYDRRPVVRSEFLLVGPSALAKPLGAHRDLSLAAARLAQAEAVFVSRNDGSGTYLMELAVWSAAKVAPAAPWYRQAAAGTSVLAQAAASQACALVEHGAWAAQPPPKGFGVLAEADPRFAVDVHVMRSFRAQHPAGKLFVSWLAGDKGRRIAASHRGYRALAA